MLQAQQTLKNKPVPYFSRVPSRIMTSIDKIVLNSFSQPPFVLLQSLYQKVDD